MRNRWIENGRSPEFCFSEEARGCARSGSTFLKLTDRGERYASTKCLRAQLMRKRKDLGSPMFTGRLEKYGDLYQIYEDAWNHRYEIR